MTLYSIFLRLCLVALWTLLLVSGGASWALALVPNPLAAVAATALFGVVVACYWAIVVLRDKHEEEVCRYGC